MTPQYQKIFGTLADCGVDLPPGARILDLGCGNGDFLAGLLELGYDAHGCDDSAKPGDHVLRLAESGRMKKLSWDPYRIPFEDESFDLVVTNQVLEHVTNYPETLLEIRRVLKPGGVSFHQFPSKYRFQETHLYVPLASFFQAKWWLRLWAELGIRNEFQSGMSPSEVAEHNYRFLKTKCRYHTRRELDRYFDGVFESHQYCELEAVRYSRLRRLYPWLRRLPLARAMISEFHARAVLLRKESGARTAEA